MHSQCYNPRIQRFLLLPSCGQRGFLLFLAVLLIAIPLPAQEWDAPAHQFAEKIVGRTQARSALSLTVKNVSSLPPGRVGDVRRALESELRRVGVNLAAPEQAVEEVRVTLSENVRGYLWVAEIGHADPLDVVMLSVPFSAPSERTPAGLMLRRTLLWSQPAQILDASGLGDAGFLVLGADAVSFYRNQGGNAQLVTTVALTHSRPWPRDLRGRLVTQSDGSFRAYLPGTQCSGIAQPLSATCRETDDPWQLSREVNAFFSNRRNFFTGAVKLVQNNQAADMGPFYSAAIYPQGDRGFWIIAFASGDAQLINSQGQAVTHFQNWGSDVASLSSDCGSGWQVLANRSGGSAFTDTLQAYEIVNREAVEAGAPLDFAGPITALWSAADERTATVVSRNGKTGNYEAYSISAACGR